MNTIKLEKLIDQVPNLMQTARVPGAVVSLIRRGIPLEHGCFGVTSIENGQAITPQTIFQAASLSKQVFAYVALKLCEQGLFDLDTPLSDILPEPYIPDEPRLAIITARRVLCHTTGLPNWCDAHPRTLKFTPGERFGYSGEGYIYLQRVMEHMTGQPLDTYMKSTWFEPLGMPDSSFIWQESIEPRIAHAHKQGERHEEYRFVEALSAASLYTTAADLARFIQQVLEPSTEDKHHLSAQWLEMMFTPQVEITPNLAWCLGWGMLRSDPPVFWQWGDNTGYKHLLAISPASGTSVIVLTNGDEGYQVWKNVLAETLDPSGIIFTWLENF
jgi:CubicO group peptidase (beta-lactamase class C family)